MKTVVPGVKTFHGREKTTFSFCKLEDGAPGSLSRLLTGDMWISVFLVDMWR